MKYLALVIATAGLIGLSANAQESTSKADSKRASKEADAADIVPDPVPAPSVPAPVAPPDAPLVETAPETVVVDTPPPAPEPVENPFRQMLLPVALTELVSTVCIPGFTGGEGPAAHMPAAAVTGMSSGAEARLTVRPQAGDLWSLSTREGDLVIGTVNGRPGACQILAPSPMAPIAVSGTLQALAASQAAFTEVERAEPNATTGAPGWVRVMSSDGVYADIVVYGNAAGGPATLYVTVG